jgi:hypothetical protein
VRIISPVQIDPDLDENRRIYSADMAFHELELVAGSLSVLGTLAVVWCYYKFDRKHPAQIILIIALLDCGLATKFILRASAWLIHPQQRLNRSE